MMPELFTSVPASLGSLSVEAEWTVSASHQRERPKTINTGCALIRHPCSVQLSTPINRKKQQSLHYRRGQVYVHKNDWIVKNEDSSKFMQRTSCLLGGIRKWKSVFNKCVCTSAHSSVNNGAGNVLRVYEWYNAHSWARWSLGIIETTVTVKPWGGFVQECEKGFVI